MSANKDYAAQCAIACTKPAFAKFLQQRYALTNIDNQDAAHLVRWILGINSRSELNAAGRWQDLHRQFSTWLNRPGEAR